MSDGMHLLFSLLILLNVVFFFLGYIVGKLNNNNYIYQEKNINKTNDKKSKNAVRTNIPISIDEKKIVTVIKTDKLEKKFDNLGDKTIVKDNIDDNINRLKQIKK